MKKSNIFWISFSDLMTSLFFIMLVLFVLAIGYLKIKNQENEHLIAELKEKEKGWIKEKEQLEKLLNLEKHFAPLIQDSCFYYLQECKKFVVKDLMGIEIFNPDQTDINPIYVDRTVAAGRKIDSFLNLLSDQNKDFSYLVIIEGNMANDIDDPKSIDRSDFYSKSYERALAVYELWVRNNISLRKHNVEVLICGSGLNGLCRDKKEENNKRFSIQIIPKISK